MVATRTPGQAGPRSRRLVTVKVKVARELPRFQRPPVPTWLLSGLVVQIKCRAGTHTVAYIRYTRSNNPTVYARRRWHGTKPGAPAPPTEATRAALSPRATTRHRSTKLYPGAVFWRVRLGGANGGEGGLQSPWRQVSRHKRPTCFQRSCRLKHVSGFGRRPMAQDINNTAK